MGILGSVLNTLGSIYSTERAISANRAEAAEQRSWNEKMVAEQNVWNEQMWNKANEYNSPTAQVERLRDAGLNPLYYGLDGSSANGLESANPLGYERAQIGAIDNPIAAGLSAAAQVAQISNIQANTAKTNNENQTETVRREEMQTKILEIKQHLQNLLAEEGLTDAQRRSVEKTIEWTDRLNEAVVAEKDSVRKLNDAQRNRIDTLLAGEELLQAKSIEDFEHRWAKIDAEIEKLVAETDLDKLDIENYALNHLNNGFMGTGVSMTNFFRQITEWKNKKNNSAMDGNAGVR